MIVYWTFSSRFYKHLSLYVYSYKKIVFLILAFAGVCQANGISIAFMPGSRQTLIRLFQIQFRFQLYRNKLVLLLLLRFFFSWHWRSYAYLFCINNAFSTKNRFNWYWHVLIPMVFWYQLSVSETFFIRF